MAVLWSSSLSDPELAFSADGKTCWMTSTGYKSAIADTGAETGKIYWEIHCIDQDANALLGAGQTSAPPGTYPGNFVSSVGDSTGGHKYAAGDPTWDVSGQFTYSANSVIGVAVDCDTGRMWFAVDGAWTHNGDPAQGLNPNVTGWDASAGPIRPAIAPYNAGDETTCAARLVTDATEAAYSPPPGFLWLGGAAATPVETALAVRWSLCEPTAAALSIRWESTVRVAAALLARWGMTTDVEAALLARWGITTDVEAALLARWGTTTDVEAALRVLHGDARRLSAGLSVRWGGAMPVERALVMLWLMRGLAETGLRIRWAIPEQEVAAALAMRWSLEERTPVETAMRIRWMVLGGQAQVDDHGGLMVVAGGVALRSVVSVEIRESEELGVIEATVVLASPVEAAGIERLHQVQIADAWGTVYELVVDELPWEETRDGADGYSASWTMVCRSRGVLLAEPHSLRYDREWPEGGMASDIAADLAGIEGVSLRWHLRDWRVPAGVFRLEDATPLEGLRALVDGVGIIQSDVDGSMYARPLRLEWAAAPGRVVLDPVTDVTGISVEQDLDEPLDSVVVSSGKGGGLSVTLEEISLDAVRSEVRAWPWPWLDEGLVLRHSGGGGVRVEDRGTGELIREEEVGVLDGQARTRYPVHEVLEVSWVGVAAGDVAAGPDGGLVVAGGAPGVCGVLRVRYRSRWRSWHVERPDGGTVLCWVPDPEVEE